MEDRRALCSGGILAWELDRFDVSVRSMNAASSSDEGFNTLTINTVAGLYLGGMEE